MPPLLLEILPPSSCPARLSLRPLPAYRYVLGLHPHPTRDPRGHGVHAQGRSREEVWRYGIDLFNARYYWEAHDAWEILWTDAPRESPRGRAVKGLIQVAASLLVLHLGRYRAARTLAERGEVLLRQAALVLPVLGGLPLSDVAKMVKRRLLVEPAPRVLEEAAFSLRVNAQLKRLWEE